MKFRDALRSGACTRDEWVREGFDRRVEIEKGQPVIYEEDDHEPSPILDLSEEDLDATDWIAASRRAS